MMNEYVFGHQNIKFKTKNYKANYMNDSVSIKLPIFIIHGNHDDPWGLEHLSNINMLSTNHTVNYFGSVTNIEEIEVNPILLIKGQTKIALYGIGHMKDERLNIAFEQKKIRFLRPKDDPESWFNILVLHQNRFKGLHWGVSKRHALTEDIIPSFINFVLWAHEHESIPKTYECQETGVHILQPGSTVQTSLIEAESREKHWFILTVYKTAFKLEPKPMKWYRPLIFQHIELSETKMDRRESDKIENHIIEVLNKMVEKANLIYKDRPETMRLPLIKLKIESTGYDTIRSQRLANHFNGRIANINEFIHCYKRTITIRSIQGGPDNMQSRSNNRLKSAWILEENDKTETGDQTMFHDIDENKQLLHNKVRYSNNKNFIDGRMIL